MFADMKSMVMKARHEHYALLAINCMNLESAHAAIRVAEKNRAPIILNLYQGHLAHFPAPVAAAVVKTLAESASVPVALALDHGKNPDCIRQAFRAGFSGLMIDASAFPRGKRAPDRGGGGTRRQRAALRGRRTGPSGRCAALRPKPPMQT